MAVGLTYYSPNDWSASIASFSCSPPEFAGRYDSARCNGVGCPFDGNVCRGLRHGDGLRAQGLSLLSTRRAGIRELCRCMYRCDCSGTRNRGGFAGTAWHL